MTETINDDARARALSLYAALTARQAQDPGRLAMRGLVFVADAVGRSGRSADAAVLTGETENSNRKSERVNRPSLAHIQ